MDPKVDGMFVDTDGYVRRTLFIEWIVVEIMSQQDLDLKPATGARLELECEFS